MIVPEHNVAHSPDYNAHFMFLQSGKNLYPYGWPLTVKVRVTFL